MFEKLNLTCKTREFLAKLAEINPPPIYEQTPEQARKGLSELQKMYYRHIDADVREFSINNGKEKPFNVQVFRPYNNDEKLPVILYVHGGGWVIAGVDDFNMYMRNLCNKANAVVICPDYSLSPEAKYPVALNQVYSTLEYIYNNADSLNIYNDKIVIAGDSAGGNMATITAIRALKENGPKIKFQALIYPVTDMSLDYDSVKDYKEGPWLTEKSMDWFKDAYLPEKYDKNDIYLSPIKASLNDLKGLPQTLVVVAENDLLRDEGEKYAERLDVAGVEVFSVSINATIHDFLMLNALAETKPAMETLSMISYFIKKHLN